MPWNCTFVSFVTLFWAIWYIWYDMIHIHQPSTKGFCQFFQHKSSITRPLATKYIVRQDPLSQLWSPKGYIVIWFQEKVGILLQKSPAFTSIILVIWCDMTKSHWWWSPRFWWLKPPSYITAGYFTLLVQTSSYFRWHPHILSSFQTWDGYGANSRNI